MQGTYQVLKFSFLVMWLAFLKFRPMDRSGVAQECCGCGLLPWAHWVESAGL